LYVTENRSSSDICYEILETLANFLQDRIDINEYFVNTIKPVVNLDCNANIKNVFEVLGKDLDLADLNIEYTALMKHNRLECHCLN